LHSELLREKRVLPPSRPFVDAEFTMTSHFPGCSRLAIGEPLG
jgi:hypothetical protein